MIIENIGAKIIKDSRNEKTISVFVKTRRGFFKTSAPSGKSTGKYEVKPYNKKLEDDVGFINKLDINKIKKLELKKFDDLKKVELLTKNKLGGNSLFVLESSLLKALAKESGKELFEFLSEKKINSIKIRPVGNSIGGGLHSIGINNNKPDFQEFLFIGNGNNFKESVKINEIAYEIAGNLLKAKKRNDEGAWETSLNNEQVLNLMEKIKHVIKTKHKKNVDIGIDIASSSFYNAEVFSKQLPLKISVSEFRNNMEKVSDKYYNYKNPKKKLKSKEQINYVDKLIKKFKLFYVEDGLREEDFKGFSRLLKSNKKSLIVGDDLTTTNPKRLLKAIIKKSVNAVIVKPNQIGSLIKVKEFIDIAKKNSIKIIISHRSGETLDNTIADLAVALECDFIKTGIYGKERKSKLNRLIEIEKSLR